MADLAGLSEAAALASGWPVLELEAASEADLDATLAALQEILGPLPQADIVEPWDDDEPYQVFVDLPGLSPEDWARVQDGVPAARLVPGSRPHEREAADLEQRGIERLDGDVSATMAFDLLEGGVLGPDLTRRPAAVDAEIVALEAELTEAIREVDPALGFLSDRGPDTITPVLWRSTGRFGFELAFPGVTPDPERRAELLAALGRVVAARADHPVLRLAPDLKFDVRAGLSFVLFAIGPAAPGLPGDGPWRSWIPVDEGLLASAEVEVLVPADEHDAAVLAVTDLARENGWIAGRSRWVRVDGVWRFVPVWHAPLVPAELPDHGRFVPGVALGLEDRWTVLQPYHHVGSTRTITRLRDGRSDRDWLRRVAGEKVGDLHRPLMDALERTKPLFPGLAETLGAIRGVRDITGRLGAEIRLNHRAEREKSFRVALDAIGGVDVPGWASVAWVGFRSDGPVVQLWRVEAGDHDVPPEWAV